jgi:hypothetical protein
MKRIRPKIGLRLMLLLVALFCVLSAYFRAKLDLRNERIRAELIALEGFQRHLEIMPNLRPQLARVNADIADKRRQLGE